MDSLIQKTRVATYAAALVLALVAVFIFGGTAFADDTTVCVDGYVINHREVAVDGTKTTPALSVEAVGANGPVSATVGSNGYFKFEELAVGDWNFRLQLPEAWDGIVPLADRGGIAETGLTALPEKTGCYRIMFKIRRQFGVIVIKWEELLDGTVQPGEDWVITATPVKDPFAKVQTATTDAGGRAGFTLTPGRWIIAETVKSGWKPITPKQVTLDLDQYAPPGARDPVVFKNLEPACHGTIVVQKIGIGTDAEGKDVVLGPLAGWKVTVSRADGAQPPVTKITDGSGKATFEDLIPGVYKVEEKVQIGWEAVGDNPQTVIHRDCETTNVTFENKEIGGDLKISGRKLFKAWVPPYKGQLVGMAGWVITATLVGTDVMTTTVTNALGDYLFPAEQLEAAGVGFPGATIDVCEEDRDNWIHVTPKCVRVKFPYPVPPNYTGAKADFINVQDPPVATGSPSADAGGACRARLVVAKGQTLGMIAARYGASIGAIARANHIKNVDLVFAGQTLCIP